MSPVLAAATDVRIVDGGFNWTPLLTLCSILVAIAISLLAQRHDSKAREDQRQYDKNSREQQQARDKQERVEDREATNAARAEERKLTQTEADFFRARNVVGGPPQRLRPRAGISIEHDELEPGGPTVINASDSVLTNVRLIGAWTPLHPEALGYGRVTWHYRRRANDGNASVVLPHDEVEFPASWVEEMEMGGEWRYRRAGSAVVMYWGIQVAFEWTDSRGQQWIRLGSAAPHLKAEYTEEELATIKDEWTARYNPDT